MNHTFIGERYCSIHAVLHRNKQTGMSTSMKNSEPGNVRDWSRRQVVLGMAAAAGGLLAPKA